jgi:NAD(P)-dependent dehydrogenase (short-subunit alcohol dehydrogenase family)
MPGVLDGKVAVIAGGGYGMMRRTALLYAEEGARVVVGDIDAGRAEHVAAEIGSDTAEAVHVDVRDEEGVKAMVDRAFTRFGRFDTALNGVGARGLASIQDCSVSRWQRVIDSHLTGAFVCVKYESARLIEQGQGGSITNISSLNGVQAGEGNSAYCAAKAGIIMLSKVAALELGPHGIRVNSIAPGIIRTENIAPVFADRPQVEEAFKAVTPLGRVGETIDVARLALFLASDAASWITGQTHHIDGGATLKKYPSNLEAFAP